MDFAHRKLLQMGSHDHHSMEEHNMGENDLGEHDMGDMGHDMGGHDMSMPMGHSMAMTFFSSNSVALWFDEWTTQSHGEYAAALIGLSLLCFLQEALNYYRIILQMKYFPPIDHPHRVYEKKGTGSDQDHSSDDTAMHQAHEHRSDGGPTFLQSTINSLVLGLLYSITTFIGYMLMLAVMSYNVGVFVTVIVSMSIAHSFCVKQQTLLHTMHSGHHH